MNIKDEHTSRLWTFIMKGEIMDLDDHELIATRVNNKAASWKEVEEYIEKYYVKKDKIRKKIEKYEDKLKQPEIQNINTKAYSYYLGKKEGWEELLQEGDDK